jgi:hypothetical protein
MFKSRFFESGVPVNPSNDQKIKTSKFIGYYLRLWNRKAKGLF